jgi:hypothetical protein
MSDPLLSKMDALLKKHRGSGEDRPDVPAGRGTEQAPPPPGAWLPVLTDVIARGTPPARPAAAAPAATVPPPAAAPARASTAEAPTIVTDVLAAQLMGELAPRLSEVMEKQVAAELRKNIDQTVATLLGQLDVNVRDIVRDAVAEKLKQPRDPQP